MKIITLSSFDAVAWRKNSRLRMRTLRRAVRMGRDGQEVQIRTPDGILVDLIPSDAEARACGYKIDRG